MASGMPNIRPWLDYFDSAFAERTVASRLASLGLLGRAHVLLLGPPGTAKSMLASEVSAMVDGKLFSTLLTRFSTPEDVFGPLSLPALEQGAYLRLTEGYLPEADIAFVDEIYKANASILNALLSILNERTFFNGNQHLEVPLRSILAASNEVPDEEDGLEALDDRLLLRLEVEAIQSPQAFISVVGGGSNGAIDRPTAISKDELSALDERAKTIKFPDDVAHHLIRVRRASQNEDLNVSDRRWKQAVSLMKVMAALDARDAISLSDLAILRFVLWKRPEEQERVPRILGEVLEDLGSSDKPGQPGMRNLTDMQNDLEEVADNILRQPQTYFSDQTRKRIEELLHKTVNLGERVLEWTDDQAKKVNEMSGLWTVFWSDSAGGSRVVAKLQKLLEHDLFSKVLPNIDARLAQKFQKESGELRGRLSQV